MKISEIFEEWDKDCKIDILHLDHESLKIPQLHNKYYLIYIREKVALRALKSKFSNLKHEKFEFLTMGPNEETKAKGWVLPPRGKILNNQVEPYLQNDKELIELSLKIGIHEEKIDLIKSILETVSNRSFQINSAIKFLAFQNGQ